MAKDMYYFDRFNDMMEHASRCACMLRDVLRDYDADKIGEYKQQIHVVEHSADLVKHAIMERLMKEFLPPIDRDDIVDIAHLLDEIPDSTEEVIEKMYMNDIKTCRSDAVEIAETIVLACDEVRELITNFSSFKKPELLKPHIIKINTLEEQIDTLHFEAMRRLRTDGTPLEEVIGWRDVYTCLEDCGDACEKLADAVEEVLMKNS